MNLVRSGLKRYADFLFYFIASIFISLLMCVIVWFV